jgi:hypothetical protein
MCYLLTIGTSESQKAVEAMLGGNPLLMVRRSRNPSLRSVFPKADQLFELFCGQCSCHLVIRSKQRSAEEHRARLQALYERRGWSQSKIARALAESESAHVRQLVEQAAPGAQCCELLRALAAKPGGLRVLIHFYAGQFDNEAIQISGRVSVPVDQLVDAGVIPEDMLAEIAPMGAG